MSQEPSFPAGCKHCTFIAYGPDEAEEHHPCPQKEGA